VLGAFAGGQSLADFDQQIGPAILTVSYVHWGTPVGHLTDLITSAWRDHAEAVLEFEPGADGRNASEIAAGTGGSDAWLDQVGHLLVRLRRHVAVSFFPEMNGPWHQGWSEGPASYVQAYRHVHAVLSGLAGWLITWIWQSSAIHKDTPSPMPWWPGAGPVRRVPLGLVAGARSGDKGGDANVGVWARDGSAWPWLVATLTVDLLRELLPEAAGLPVTRHLLPNLHAVNFVIEGLLGQGVAAAARFDPQAKALGEWLRARHLDVPEELL